MAEIHCDQHKTRLASKYCIQCLTYICIKCESGDHKKHNEEFVTLGAFDLITAQIKHIQCLNIFTQCLMDKKIEVDEKFTSEIHALKSAIEYRHINIMKSSILSKNPKLVLLKTVDLLNTVNEEKNDVKDVSKAIGLFYTYFNKIKEDSCELTVLETLSDINIKNKRLLSKKSTMMVFENHENVVKKKIEYTCINHTNYPSEIFCMDCAECLCNRCSSKLHVKTKQHQIAEIIKFMELIDMYRPVHELRALLDYISSIRELLLNAIYEEIKEMLMLTQDIECKLLKNRVDNDKIARIKDKYKEKALYSDNKKDHYLIIDHQLESFYEYLDQFHLKISNENKKIKSHCLRETMDSKLIKKSDYKIILVDNEIAQYYEFINEIEYAEPTLYEYFQLKKYPHKSVETLDKCIDGPVDNLSLMISCSEITPEYMAFYDTAIEKYAKHTIHLCIHFYLDNCKFIMLDPSQFAAFDRIGLYHMGYKDTLDIIKSIKKIKELYCEDTGLNKENIYEVIDCIDPKDIEAISFGNYLIS